MKNALYHRWIGGLVLLAGIGMSGPTVAETTAPGEGTQRRHKMPFEEMDQNKDGKLTLEEHRNFHESKSKQWFQDMDLNKDGAVTQEEIKSAHERRGPKKFEDLDANRDGQINKEEFETGREKR